MEDFMVAAVESAVSEIAICALLNGNSNISMEEHMKESSLTLNGGSRVSRYTSSTTRPAGMDGMKVDNVNPK